MEKKMSNEKVIGYGYRRTWNGCLILRVIIKRTFITPLGLESTTEKTFVRDANEVEATELMKVSL